MLALDETASTRACGVQDSVPCGVGDAVSTKNLVPEIAEYLKKVLRTVRKSHLDWFLEEIGVERDHVHLHMVIPPKYAIPRVAETLKTVTNR